jgi:putative peptide zinc metalloprotease protein
MFSTWFATLCVLLIASAVGLVVLHFDTLRARLPDFYSFFSAGNLIWLAVAVALAKVLHELGHALACRHFGGECHELGLMLLVFTPCLYCNVSDVWMMADHWRRIAVGAAGMAVELVLAAVATLLWWWTAPGLFNGLCLNLMFVCSVSTLVFNGNPLLRYDGYYILSDLLETPNLGERANRVVLRWLAEFAWGVNLPPERLLPDRGRAKLATYAIAAAVYRVFVVAAVLWFLYHVLQPYHLEALAELLAVASIGGMIVVPSVRTVKWVRDQQRNQRMHWGRFFVRMGWVAAAIVVLLIVPLPNRLKAPAVIEPAGAQRIYVTVPGTVVEAARAGQEVKAGDVVARLENADVVMELTQLQARRDREQLHLNNLRRQQGADSKAAAQIPTAEKALAEADAQLAQRRRDQERLTLTAPRDGAVLPPHQQQSNAAAGELPAWTGTPLDPRNEGAYLETGTLVCLVGDPKRLEATLVVDQADVELVRAGQQVRIQLDELPDETLSGTVEEVSELNLKTAPRDLAARGELAVRPDAKGAAQPLGTVYEARVSITAAGIPIRSGATGMGKIYAEPQSLGRRLLRYFEQTFQLRG